MDEIVEACWLPFSDLEARELRELLLARASISSSLSLAASSLASKSLISSDEFERGLSAEDWTNSTVSTPVPPSESMWMRGTAGAAGVPESTDVALGLDAELTEMAVCGD